MGGIPIERIAGAMHRAVMSRPGCRLRPSCRRGAISGDEDADKLNIPIPAFDLIVADECHRGYSAKELSIWRNTLDWFDGIKIGLTATPAAHTMAYFEHPVYRYDYERAVREGYLVDYDVVAAKSPPWTRSSNGSAPTPQSAKRATASAARARPTACR